MRESGDHYNHSQPTDVKANENSCILYVRFFIWNKLWSNILSLTEAVAKTEPENTEEVQSNIAEFSKEKNGTDLEQIESPAKTKKIQEIPILDRIIHDQEILELISFKLVDETCFLKLCRKINLPTTLKILKMSLKKD